MRTLLSTALLLIAIAAQAEISAIYGKYGPTGAIAASQPLLSWKLTPTGGGRISRVEMSLNDHPVQATVSQDTIEYQPTEPLGAGLYTVVCRATIEGQLVARQDWSFEVDSDNGPTASATYATGFAMEETNAIRSELGLPALVLDEHISAAAAAHSRYQFLNGLTCHTEEPGKPGFCGKAPWDRLRRFGYLGTCYEGACGNQMDPRKAIRLLFDAPYHRIAFLQPGTPSVGIGFDGGSLTIDYAVSSKEGVGVSPAPGQRGTPREWDGNETPSPLKSHGASGAVGYPIVFSWFSPSLEAIRISSAHLFGPDGTEVPAYVNSPENDEELRFAGIITPKAKLKPMATYRVEVRARTEHGVRIDKTWTFTTGG